MFFIFVAILKNKASLITHGFPNNTHFHSSSNCTLFCYLCSKFISTQIEDLMLEFDYFTPQNQFDQNTNDITSV